MRLETIKASLCLKDNRNPDYFIYDMDEPPQRSPDCMCDNCFYGRDEMARYMLILLDALNALRIARKTSSGAFVYASYGEPVQSVFNKLEQDHQT